MDIQATKTLLDKLATDFPTDTTITAIRFYIIQRLEAMKNEEVYDNEVVVEEITYLVRDMEQTIRKAKQLETAVM